MASRGMLETAILRSPLRGPSTDQMLLDVDGIKYANSNYSDQIEPGWYVMRQDRGYVTHV